MQRLQKRKKCNEGDSAVKIQVINFPSKHASNFTTIIVTRWPSWKHMIVISSKPYSLSPVEFLHIKPKCQVFFEDELHCEFYSKCGNPRAWIYITHLNVFRGFIYHELNVLGCLGTRDSFIPASDFLYPIKQWHLIYHTRKLLDWMLLTRIFITSDDRDVGSICSQLAWLIRNWNAGYYPFFLLNGLIGSWQTISLLATRLTQATGCPSSCHVSLAFL